MEKKVKLLIKKYECGLITLDEYFDKMNELETIYEGM